MPHPPVVLVKTWFQLFSSNEKTKARKHAEKMLTDAFGNQQAALRFLKDNKIV